MTLTAATEQGRIARTSTATLRKMADKAKTDDMMLVCLLKLSEKEGPQQMRRVEAALGISKAERVDINRDLRFKHTNIVEGHA